MRVLLTGATGFLGSFVLRRLLEQGADVAVLLRPESDPWRIQDALPRAVVIEGRMERIEESEEAIRSFRPEAACHLAWSGVHRRSRDEISQVGNVEQAVRLARVSIDAGCRAWLGVGSQAEGSADTLYGASKLAARHMTRIVCERKGLRWAWLRVFSLYGPTEDRDWLLPALILGLARNAPPEMTDGTQERDYLYVEDAARAVAACLASPSADGVFELGSGEALPVRRLAELARDLCAPGLPLKFGSLGAAAGPARIQADISRIRGTTGWAPTTDLSRGLAETCDWYRRNAERRAGAPA